ncbi:MAG TPA: hypothetical protein VFK09_04470 [Gemmatimonadales bacterium]|jgi:hypothetical protein|nr:hypothetical protein [Gemmatimonadales bacterium]
MRLAPILVLLGGLAAGRQDDWRPVALTRLDPPPDSAIAAGVLLTPEPGALVIGLAFENPCGQRARAGYQWRGAVIKLRLTGPSPAKRCRGTPAPEAYEARIGGLKPKRYQVIVLTEDPQQRWRPWKAAVATVP